MFTWTPVDDRVDEIADSILFQYGRSNITELKNLLIEQAQWEPDIMMTRDVMLSTFWKFKDWWKE